MRALDKSSGKVTCSQKPSLIAQNDQVSDFVLLQWLLDTEALNAVLQRVKVWKSKLTPGNLNFPMGFHRQKPSKNSTEIWPAQKTEPIVLLQHKVRFLVAVRDGLKVKSLAPTKQINLLHPQTAKFIWQGNFQVLSPQYLTIS